MAATARVLPYAGQTRPTVERAFEIARSGSCESVPAIAAMLKDERHEAVDAHLAGPSIRLDLRRSWEAARSVHGGDGPFQAPPKLEPEVIQ